MSRSTPTQKNYNQTRSNQIKCPCLIDSTVLCGPESMAMESRWRTQANTKHVFLILAKLKYSVGSVSGRLGVVVHAQSIWQAGSDTSNSVLHLVFLFIWISENLVCAIIKFWAHCYIPTESSKSAHPYFLPLDRFPNSFHSPISKLNVYLKNIALVWEDYHT